MQLAGLQLGRYRLVRLIGSGGMGEVYLAEDTHIERHVAIKLFRNEGAHDAGSEGAKKAARLFQREMKAISMLDHPNILSLFDYGKETVDGLLLTYMVMSFRRDGSLANWLRHHTPKPLSPESVDHLLQQAADALQHAHDRHIIHRDVKLSNFLIRLRKEKLDYPDLLLADFGIAKFYTAVPSVSTAIRGTPTYMAPEQWKGQAFAATDQYALAVMTYELLTNRPPFRGNLEQMIYSHLNIPPDPPGMLVSSIPPEVDRVILRALEKKPENRFDSITAFANAFQEALRLPDQSAALNVFEPREVSRSTDSPTIANSTRSRQALLLTNIQAASHPPKATKPLPHVSTPTIQPASGLPDGENGDIAIAQPPGECSPASDQNKLEQSTLPAADLEKTKSGLSAPDHASKEDKIGVRRRDLSKGILILLVGLLLLGLIEGAGLLHFATANRVSAGVTEVTVTATATAVLNPSSLNGLATVLNDPLHDNSKGYNWDVNAGNCQFSAGGYLVKETQQGLFHYCVARATDFSDFAYQVQMAIISGDYGGLIFRADAVTGQYYYFRVGRDESYVLARYVDNQSIHAQILTDGVSPIMGMNLNRANLILIVAKGSAIDLYVNHHYIASVQDASYSHGQIAVAADDEGNATEVLFSEAKVWAV